MKKFILTETQIKKIVGDIVIEQGSMFGTAGTDIPGYRKDDVRNKPVQSKPKQKENINPKNLKLGDGGNKNPKQKPDVIALQQKLMDIGCLVTDTMKPTGYFGNVTNDALTRYNKNECGKSDKPNVNKKPTEIITILPEFKSLKVSDQVKKQLSYLSNNKILKNDRFTILDDKNNTVYSFNPNYKLLKTYSVLTGKDIGDQLKTQSMTDWALENWQDVGLKIWDSIKQFVKTKGKTKPSNEIANFIDDRYFNQPVWKVKNTPSGVFKRAGNVENFMNDWLATTFIAKDYGKRFITWQTCGGETIPFGFHGTQNVQRLNVLNNKNIKNIKKNMSFGCINFKEDDVLDIDKFITANQISIWLPDTSDDIVEVPNNCIKSSFINSLTTAGISGGLGL